MVLSARALTVGTRCSRLRSNVRDRSRGAGSPFRELGQFQHRLEQFQRDFDEVFDRCLRARWRSAMRPRALPVESHIEGDQVVIRADLPWVDPKTPEWPKETEFQIAERDNG